MSLRKTGFVLVALFLAFSAAAQGVSSPPSASAIPTIGAVAPTLDLGRTGGGEGDNAGGAAFADALDTPVGRAALAMVTPDYPVTPGDTYTLTFITAGGAVTSSILVDSDYIVGISNLGKINAKGMLFQNLRKEIEKRVLSAYPLSAPQLFIQNCGVFPVYVQGEVASSSIAYAWGLSRLSSLWKRVTPFASNRDVLIQRRGSPDRRYDLFKAWRAGDLSQDPYLQPNDTVVIGRYGRSVTIKGQVNRPGQYQLLPQEGLEEVLCVFAGGLLPTARADYANITRLANGTSATGSSLFFDAAVIPGHGGDAPAIYDGDSIFIPSRESFLPVIYFEGAISTGTTVSGVTADATDKAAPMAAARQYAMDRQVFKPGDKLSRAIRSEAAAISPGADLKRAFIVRKGESSPIAVDLEKLLYAYDPALDVELKAEDRIVIPYGNLDVFVTGEVTKSSWVSAGALMRLSALVAPYLTRYSSIRDVLVTDANGETKAYDLFRAEREGDLSQDPFVKAGDIVRVNVVQRAVSVSGEVKRPGTYQLLPGEGLRELLEGYAQGFTELANPARLFFTRYTSEGGDTDILGKKSILDYVASSDVKLRNYDAITVSPTSDLMPVVYFEGALGASKDGLALDASNRIPYTFMPGEMLSQAVQHIKGNFTEVSDLQNAYIRRGDARLPVNIANFIYGKNFAGDMPLLKDDVIIVPFRQFFVSVSGAVMTPGRYPYVPDRSWEYYVGLAGGLDENKNAWEQVFIVSIDGKRYGKDRIIQPEDTIAASSNSFVYQFGRVSAIMSAIVSVAALLISLLK